MSNASQTAVPITRLAAVAVVLTTGAVCGFYLGSLPIVIGMLAACSVLAGLLPVHGDKGRLAVAVALVLLGLGVAWTASDVAGRTGRLLHDLGWAQTLLGLLQCYMHASALTPRKTMAAKIYGPEALARWRSGDMRFGLDLAARVVVRAQPSWATLVLEVAWPEPRPDVVGDLLRVGASADERELRRLLERMNDKGGTSRAEARWELARLACEVSLDARARPAEDLGGVVASRFVVAAAAVEGDDDQMAQVFSALVIPAVANPR